MLTITLDVSGDAIPYGYDLIKGKLMIKDDEAMKVKLMFSLFYLQEKSLDDIADKTKSDIAKIEKILINPIYFGKILFGGKVHQGNHPAIITKKYCKINKINVDEIVEKFLASM